MMRTGYTLFGITLATCLASACADAAPWYARGEFNNWGTDNQMTETAPGSNVFKTTVGGLTPGTRFEFKVGSADWTTSFPANNARVYSDATGNITFFYYAGNQADGRNPAADRVGYADPGIAWDLMGSFDNWTNPVSMTGPGNGVYTADMPLVGGTNYEFKFRKAGDWGLNIGQTFANDGSNAAFTPATTDTYRFQLDLGNGAWSVAAVPEPAFLGAVGAASLSLLVRRRRTS
jgi:hypothetical protein